jgi:hypothetical protein
MKRRYKMNRLEKIASRLADDLVQMHKDTAIEIEFWGNALELVAEFYSVDIAFKKKERNND